MNNEGNPKRKRLRTLSQIESQRSPLKMRSPIKNSGKIQFTSAYALLKQFQIKREHILAACGDSSKHETMKKGKMPKKKLTRFDVEGQSKMATKKITNMKNREDQIKMPTKNCNEENHLVKMKANEIEGQSGKKPSRKKVPMKKSKMEDDKTKMNTNDADGQSKKPTNKKMLMKKSNEEDANEEEHKIESLIPAMTLDEFFKKYGISLDENDEEYKYDYDDHNPSVGDSSDSQLGNSFIFFFNSK
ncbi:hypothetical protein HN51_035965 [Arachis hypogaea]